MTTTSDLTAQRTARARAFVKQDLKKGRAWSSLTYEYDTENTPVASQEAPGRTIDAKDDKDTRNAART